MKLAEPPERDRIAEKVQEALDRHQPRKYRVTVNAGAIYLRDDWYHILVESPDDVRDRDFYDALAEAEADLEDEDGHPFLLVPAFGD